MPQINEKFSTQAVIYCVVQDIYIEAAGTELDLELQATLQLNYRYLEQFVIEQHFKSLVIPHLLDSIRIQWYHNGTAVDSSRTISSLEQQGEELYYL